MSVWLTHITPNPRSQDARRDMAGHEVAMNLHRRLMSLYPADAGSHSRARFGVLFRIDDTPIGPHILLQSTHQPDLTRLPDDYGTTQSRPLDTLLDALKPGLTIHYRCAASPVRKPGATTRALYNLPPVVPLTGAHADEWWTRQADTAGLKPLTLRSRPLDTVHATRTPAAGTPQHIRHARTRFDGSATVTDPDILRQKITEGIGRGKAYGCGLLSVAPARKR
ncbi:CRISPR system Cascade subunit CasE [Streptomyces umbrinus]|uniref:CRISPR system Cascade subunit CasE n=1 Tax=Streptomyces umbrinus TaxID=67370 RepID=A0ABU0T197_9ACTN|nr:type I-E CRISPR-associated protein Cas6/Cse3/CasE [Streptomyces umbrinus]MDQ1029472.1 CRISPR system Cascade subunit CasE [Streptomyces umbrinus]